MAVELTPRQREVVRLVSLGCTVEEIALILDLSPSTVDNHKTRAMQRLSTNKVALLTLCSLLSEQPAEQRQIAEEWGLVLTAVDTLADKPADYCGVTVLDNHFVDNLSL